MRGRAVRENLVDEDDFTVHELPFDSSWWGIPTMRLTSVKSEFALGRADEYFCSTGPVLVYFYCSAEDISKANWAQAQGYRLVDVRVDMARTLDAAEDGYGRRILAEEYIVRDGTMSDISPLRRLAAQNHKNSRFYRDDRLPMALCDALYARWIERDIRDSSTTVLVAQSAEGPVGYVSCRIDGTTARVGLLGVDASHRKLGLAGALLAALISELRNGPSLQIVSATQGSNVVSQLVHQRIGFTTTEVGLWHHRWFTVPVAS
jgi:GNAT superfamily N-acetyltransferase